PVGMERRRCRCRRPPRAPRAAPAGDRAARDAENYRLNHDNPSMQTPGEEALVERARRGDPDAFETLVLAYQSLAFRTALLIAGDAADAEEAAPGIAGGTVKSRTDRALARLQEELQ